MGPSEQQHNTSSSSLLAKKHDNNKPISIAGPPEVDLMRNAELGKCLLGFFDDIYIPAFALPDPSHIKPHDDDPKQVKWVWKYNDLQLSYDDESEHGSSCKDG